MKSVTQNIRGVTEWQPIERNGFPAKNQTLTQCIPNCVPQKFYVLTKPYTFHLNLGYLFQSMCAAAKFRIY